MLDYVLAIFLIASPFLFGFSDDGTAAAFFIVLGVVAPAAHDRDALRHRRAPAPPTTGRLISLALGTSVSCVPGFGRIV